MDKLSMGVAVFVIQNTPANLRSDYPNFIGGRRAMTNRVSPGILCIPGGKTEGNESFENTAVREVMEETGCKILLARDPKESEYCHAILGVHDHRPRARHLTMWMVALAAPGAEPVNTEPEKQEYWGWTNMLAFLEEAGHSQEQQYWTPHMEFRRMNSRIATMCLSGRLLHKDFTGGFDG